MSAAIYWQAVKGKRLRGQSSFAAALSLPRDFEESDVDWLRGFAAGNEDYRTDVEELLEAIENHGRVRVWAEY